MQRNFPILRQKQGNYFSWLYLANKRVLLVCMIITFHPHTSENSVRRSTHTLSYKLIICPTGYGSRIRWWKLSFTILTTDHTFVTICVCVYIYNCAFARQFSRGNSASRTCCCVVYETKGYVVRTAMGSKVCNIQSKVVLKEAQQVGRVVVSFM